MRLSLLYIESSSSKHNKFVNHRVKHSTSPFDRLEFILFNTSAKRHGSSYNCPFMEAISLCKPGTESAISSIHNLRGCEHKQLVLPKQSVPLLLSKGAFSTAYNHQSTKMFHANSSPSTALFNSRNHALISSRPNCSSIAGNATRNPAIRPSEYD